MQGLILLSKPNGITSFGAVARIKRLAHEKRVGHTGTLDPMATGVLPVFLGRATALSGLLLDADKSYKAKVKLGITTDTDDITGNVLSETKVNITNEELERVLEEFIGKLKQKPPIYSALKKDGQRLYDLARKGEEVEVEEREIEVFSIKLLSNLDENNTFSIETRVSKGTYIRSLARDIGERLGVGATLTELERTETGGFSLQSCVDLEKLSEENITDYIIDEEKAVSHLRQIEVTKKQAIRFSNGGQLGFERLKISDIKDNELFRIKFDGLFLGIGIAETDKNQIGIKCIINYPKGDERN